MNFALLWIEVLLISLLWVATLAAFVGRLKRRWVRGLLVSVVLGVPLFFLGTFVFGASVMKFSTKIEPSWFIPALSLLLAYLAGVIPGSVLFSPQRARISASRRNVAARSAAIRDADDCHRWLYDAAEHGPGDPCPLCD